eukprot:6183445-Pleurochrysis_carterae.AAC.1
MGACSWVHSVARAEDDGQKASAHAIGMQLQAVAHLALGRSDPLPESSIGFLQPHLRKSTSPRNQRTIARLGLNRASPAGTGRGGE